MCYETIHTVAGLAYVELNCTASWKHNINVLVDVITRSRKLS